jgi:hypothetical protein
MDDLDQAIKAKQIEMQSLTEAMNANSIAHERNPGEPMVINSADDLIKYSVLRKRRDIADIEYDILLDQKSSGKSFIDINKAEKHIADLRREIEKDEKELSG